MTAARITHDSMLTLDDLVAVARAAVKANQDQRASLRTAQQEVERVRKELARRHRDTEQTNRDLAKWDADWTLGLSRSWLGKCDPEPSPASVKRVLDDVAILESTLESRAAMAERIEKMEQDKALFTEGVLTLAKKLGDHIDPERAVPIYDNMIMRLNNAIHDRKTLRKCIEEIEVASIELTKIDNDLAEIRIVAHEMLKSFRVDSLRGVQSGLRQVKRRDAVRKKLSECEANLVQSMRANSLEEAETALACLDPKELKRKIAEIKVQLEGTSGRTNDLFVELGRAEDAISRVGGDGAVAQLEAEKRTVLLEIEEGVLAYLRVRLGIEAAERALRAYRDEHRNSMIRRASKAFRTISRGTYSRLDTQLTDKGEVLMGIGASGGSKIASEMSKGGRFQLYLALRIAGYFEFAKHRVPVPFVADDMLETFDDLRAEEAFRIFAEMGRVGQVIYLTHHRHLCNIARKTCPEIKIHELPDPVVQSSVTPGQ